MKTTNPDQVFEIAELLQRKGLAVESYLEFVGATTFSAGLFVLPSGNGDFQRVHCEKELYYVIRGRAEVKIGSDRHAVNGGSAIFVDANVEHGFVDIKDTLVALVFFAPAKSL